MRQLGIYIFRQYVERQGLSFSGSYRWPCTVRKEELKAMENSFIPSSRTAQHYARVLQLQCIMG